MDQKVLLLLVVLALVGIAYYVRFKPHRTRGASTTTAETAAPTSKPPKGNPCADSCIRTWTKCSGSCSFDRPCSNRCDHAKESCLAACP